MLGRSAKDMKTVTFLLSIALAVSVLGAAEARVTFFKRDQEGIFLKNNSKSMIFVYNLCSLDFRVIASLMNQPFEMSLEEKTDPESAAKNHFQAADSDTHGYFVEAGHYFIVDFPPGYTNKTFPNDVLLRLRYRGIVVADDDKLVLSKRESTDIGIGASDEMNAEQD